MFSRIYIRNLISGFLYKQPDSAVGFRHEVPPCRRRLGRQAPAVPPSPRAEPRSGAAGTLARAVGHPAPPAPPAGRLAARSRGTYLPDRPVLRLTGRPDGRPGADRAGPGAGPGRAAPAYRGGRAAARRRPGRRGGRLPVLTQRPIGRPAQPAGRAAGYSPRPRPDGVVAARRGLAAS